MIDSSERVEFTYSVTPVIVTRGNVDLTECRRPLEDQETYPGTKSLLIWNNSRAAIDMKLVGTYAPAAVIASRLMYVQDDDCVVTNWRHLYKHWGPGRIVCNMAPDFQEAYRTRLDKLVGHGAMFEVDLVRPTFARYFEHFDNDEVFLREASRIFTALNFDRLVVVDVGHVDLEWASAPDRLWKQPEHGDMGRQALERARFILKREGKL